MARFASPDTALELFGTWARQQADAAPAITLDFYDANRRALRWASQMMTWQQPGHYQALDEQYLVMPDGSCCLPVAYVVAFSHFSLGKIQQWIERLDAMLEGPQVTGDVRASWLIARAQAEEIRRGRPGRHQQTLDRLLAGLGYLEEASLVAQSPEAKLRVYGELIARHGAEERVDYALQIIQQARTAVTEPGAADTLGAWQQQLEALTDQIAQRRKQREEFAQQAYLQRLRARYQKAEAAENEASASRYRALLIQAGAKLE